MNRHSEKKATKSLLICLLLILLSSFGSYLVQTDFGKIEIQSLTIPGKNGRVIQADLFRPRTATEENKAPLVVVTPGFQRTKETQISNSLELARRGFVTICVDPYNQGESDSSAKEDNESALIPVIEFATKSKEPVDQDKVCYY